MKVENQRESYKKKIQVSDEEKRLAMLFTNLFESPDGKIILKYLREEFYDVSMVGQEDHITQQRVGQHSVILHILEYINLTKQAD